MHSYLARFTFYDIVGYLFPGSIGIVAIIMVASMVDKDLFTLLPSGIAKWGVLAVAAYFTGHVLQAIASKVLRRSFARKWISRNFASKCLFNTFPQWICEELGLQWYERVQSVLKQYEFPPSLELSLDLNQTQEEKEEEKKKKKKDLLDKLDMLKLPSSGQETYVARQGFYRGGAAAFFLMAFVLLLSAISYLPYFHIPKPPLSVFGIDLPSGLTVGFMSVVCLFVAGLFAVRYFDFVRFEFEFGVAEALRSSKTDPNSSTSSHTYTHTYTRERKD